MSRLIESIRLADGKFFNVAYHQARMNASVFDLFHEHNTIDLKKYLHTLEYPRQGLFKCRILYDRMVQQANIVPYIPKVVKRLRTVESNDIEYRNKLEDRSGLEELYNKRDGCDDIIIVKNGLITDSSYSNLIFSTGSDWVTPQQPLLKGVMRQGLLDAGKIRETSITIDDISNFKSCRLINAMVGFNGPELSISEIVF